HSTPRWSFPHGHSMFLPCAFRDPMVRMYQKTFYYHFNNRPILSYRNDTWLCFEVETNKDTPPSLLLLSQGDSKTPCHAEDCFLTWFQDMLSSDQDYQVTWYTSWSPCPECAGLVADFLATHTNVSLTIFAARLYYGQDPDYQQGLRRLNKEGKGARVRIMYYEEFEHCWAKFVYNHGKPWVANNNKLKKNYQQAACLPGRGNSRNQMSWCSWPGPFCHCPSPALPAPPPTVPPSLLLLSQAPPKTPCHAENCFLTWFNDLLSSDQDYQVTWYASWSPCADCAELVADFLATQRNVSLTIFAARLYYHREPEIQRGLRRMHQKGAQLHIMSLPEFQHCWENFVHNQGKQFQPWDGLNENHQLLDTQLQEILR
uniref:CMP/dCMP-type deaminase domain-containing protein n=1 Tax=Prolemur simus TaxID=1328070 RepID=A0A8C8YRW2_PROSS